MSDTCIGIILGLMVIAAVHLLAAMIEVPTWDCDCQSQSQQLP